MKHLRTRLFAALLAASAIVCTACGAAANGSVGLQAGGKGYDSASASDYNYSYNYDAAESVVMSEAKASMLAGTGASDTSAAADALADRKIIRTLRISAETKAFDQAASAIEAQTAALGGYIESSSRSGGSIRSSGSVVARTADYTLRIPAEQLDAFRAGLGSDINIVSESSSVSDITDQYFDVDARLETLKIQEERLLAMLETATELEYMLTLEERLAEVRYEIESYTGTLRRYDSQVAYSTVRLTLEEVIEYTAVTPTPQTFGERLGVAFRDSWSSFADGCKNFAIGFVYVLPTLLVLAVIFGGIIGIVVAVVKKARKKGE